MVNNEGIEIATLGAGCFWCVEAVFQDLKGVQSVVSGYCNGKVENPTYREVCSGTTGHVEAVQVSFDPSIISFEKILEVFWTTHDPTTLNQQGADRGTQYRSGIYYNNETQKEKTERSLQEIGQKLWNGKVVTEIVAAEKFYVAEAYHQNYYKQNSNQGYCRVVINPKVSKLKATFGELLKEEAKN